MNPKPISIPVLDYHLAADYHDTGHDKHILYVLLGRGSSKARVAQFVSDIIAQAGLNALVLNNSGHGDSPFTPEILTPAQYLLETIAVFDQLRAKHPHAQLSVLGTSYGGLMAAWLTRYRPVHKLVLRTPALFQPADFYTSVEHQDQSATLAYRADATTVAANPLFHQSPINQFPTLLMIHGQDAFIPPTVTDAYQQNFSAKTYLAPAFTHSIGDASNPRDQFPAYQSAIADFLAK